jgi:ABC-type uncharacterized transport system permease subunit
MTQITTISILAAAAYLLAAGLVWIRLTRVPLAEQTWWHGRLTIGFLVVAGLVLHGAVLAQTLFSPQGLNLALTGVASLVAFVAVLMLALASVAQPFENLGIAILPLAAFSLQLAWLVPGEPVFLGPTRPAQTAHIIVSLLAYSLLFLAALQSGLLLIQERHLRAHQPGGFIRSLPPMETMERLMFRMIEIGFLLLTLTLISGIFFSEALFGEPMRFSHHIVLSTAAWLVFGILLLGHWRLGWRGRIAVRWTLGGFILLVLAYFGSKFVLEFILHRPV